MNKDWKVKKLGEVLIKASSNVSKKQLIDDEGVYPIYGASGFIKNVSFYHQDKAYISIVKDGAGIGRIAIQNAYSSVIGTLQYLLPKENVDIRFMYYFLSGMDFYKYKFGSTIPHIYFKGYSEESISIPPLPEQQRIVSILDKTFDAIGKATENAERNLHNARELFESYLQNVFATRNEGWVNEKLGAVCGFVRGPFGGSLKKSIFVPEGYAIYEQKHAIHNHFDGLRYFIDEEKFNEMKRFELLPGDLIMSCSGVTLGRVAVVPKGIKRGIINQALLKLTPTDKISIGFLKYWMESKAFQDDLKIYSGGAAIPNVSSVKVLKEIRIPLPSFSEQERVVQSIDSVLAETKQLGSTYNQKLADLEELKKSILQKAFNGEL